MTTETRVENKAASTEAQTKQPTQASRWFWESSVGLMVEEGGEPRRPIRPKRELPLPEQLSAGKIYGFRG